MAGTIPLDTRQRFIEHKGHVLLLGGPGSGKTTAAIEKAKVELATNSFARGQRVLFLSFARATVARIIEQSKKSLSREVRDTLEIGTYHGFCWNLLRSHGYLLRRGRGLRILTPPDAASRFAGVEDVDLAIAKEQLFAEHGLIHFDLFAKMTAKLLGESK